MSASLPRLGRRAEPDTAARQDAHRLAALVRDCAEAGVRRRCLVLHLSRLPAELRRPHHLRLARDTLDALLSADRAQRFLLPNHDIAMIWRGPASALLEASRTAVTRMFDDAHADMPEPDSMWRALELPGDSETLLALIADSLSDAAPAAGPPAGAALDATALAALEAALAHADVARFARRRAVCARAPDGRFRIAWDVRHLAADALCAELAPGRAAQAEPWLYRRLTRTLDRRLLALMADGNELRAAGPFGLDLNVASMVGPEFLRFDAALPQSLRGRVTLGLLGEDILADPPTFLFARDFARARGYRLLLRLPAGALLAVLPTSRLGLDFVEIGWSAAAVALPSDLLDQEAGKVVLAGADSADALAWGQAQGISLFEGRAALPGQPPDR
jgi:hypothetical protein